MNINIKGKEHEIKFSFNSFKYMEDLNLNELQTIDETPFRLATIVETLLLGGLNSNPKKPVTLSDIDEFLEDYINTDGSLVDLIEGIMTILQESSFFKSLQRAEK